MTVEKTSKSFTGALTLTFFIFFACLAVQSTLMEFAITEGTIAFFVCGVGYVMYSFVSVLEEEQADDIADGVPFCVDIKWTTRMISL